MKKYVIAPLAVVALGAVIAWAQVITIPPPAGVNLMACVYNLTPVTLTSGQPAYAQCDSTGHLVTGGGGAGGNSTIISPLGASTAPSAAVSITDTGTPITGQSLLAGGEGLKGWLSQIYATANSAIPAGTNLIGKVGIDQTTNGTTNAVVQLPATSGGIVIYPTFQPTASDNHQTVKNGPGQVYKVSVSSITSVINFLRLYNAASGFNGCNSATGLLYQMAIPANSSNAGGFADSWPLGMAFSTGISLCVTSGIAQNDTTNATAGSIMVNLGYK